MEHNISKDTFWSTRMADILDATQCAASAPGGGAIAAMAAAFGAALLLKSLRISMKKTNENRTEQERSISQLEQRMASLKQCPAKDIHAFQTFMHVYRAPTDEVTYQAAAFRLAEETFQIAQEIGAVIVLAEELYQAVHIDILADVGVGLALLESALRSTRINFIVNRNLTSPQQQAILSEKADAYLQDMLAKISKIQDYIAPKLNCR